MKFKLLALIVFLIFFSKVSISHENKIAYLDLNVIMTNSIAGKSINNQLEKKHKKNIKNFEKIEEKLKKEESEIIAGIVT